MRKGIGIAVVGVLAMLTMAGCGAGADGSGEPAVADAGQSDVADAAQGDLAEGSVETRVVDDQIRMELEGKFNAYAQALIDGDYELLNNVISSEIQDRLVEKGADIAAFAQKMKASMLKQFSDMSDATSMGYAFTVTDIQEAGGGLRVEVARNGEALAKPFYFVNEGGEYKLNLLRPGFTKTQPDGSGAGKDTYRVKNLNEGVGWVNCSGATSKTVNMFAETTISCDNKCGWWSGSRFTPGGIYCDWNSWGVDVYLDNSTQVGAFCNDPC
jgi:hypothetical protein